MPVFVLLSLFLYRCDPPVSETEVEVVAEELPAAIKAYTSGVIGREENIFVQFADVPEGEAEYMISVSPATEGLIALRGTGLTFFPKDGWEAGTNYTATVKIAGENDFIFNFSTTSRKAEVLADGLFIQGGEEKGVEVTGRVVTNDAATVEEVSKLLSAKQGDKTVSVEVAAGNDDRHFTYTVAAPDRGKDPAPVVIMYDGSKSGFSTTKGELKVAIPASDDFRVESMVLSETEDGALLARFTDALDPKQDFNGLVVFPGRTSYTTRVNGNLLYIYPKSDNLGEVTIRLSDGIQNRAGYRLGRETSWKINLGRTEPGLRIVSKGTILPHQGKRMFPFEAVGLKGVQVEIVEIFSGNVGQYLQDNSLGDRPNDWTLRRVGKIIAQESVPLSSLSEGVNASRWSRYALDLSKYIKADASAIYQVRVGFGMEDAVAGCDVGPEDFGLELVVDQDGEEDFTLGFRETPSRMGDYYGIHGHYDDFNWEDQDNPCMPAYYNRNRFLTANLLSSNLGLIVKRNPDRSTVVFATDLINAAPRAGVAIKVFSYQQQELFSGTTDSDGRVNLTTTEEPATIIASAGDDAAYLAIDGDTGLGLSRFDIGGVQGDGGIKGAFYAERGVWRPGDTVFLNFVLEDREKRLPKNYPVEFTLTDAQGRVVERRNVRSAFDGGLYPLTFTTKKKDVTGNWTATVRAGGESYRKQLMIETVKPNRLSIDLELPEGGLNPAVNNVTLVSKWLYGAPGADLKAKMEMMLFSRPAKFPKWMDFAFTDPARKLNQGSAREIFEGQLNEAGKAAVSIPLDGGAAPGPLAAGITTKVFEPGGNFSIDNQRIPFDPYSVYTGLNIPKDDWGSRRVSMENPSTIELAAVDTKGEGVSGRQLTAGLYRVNWRYWWQDNYDNVARFNSSRHTEALETYKATTGSDGSANIKVMVSDWGRYLLRVCDSGGHCSGQYFYAGYNMDESDRESASLLRPVADREEVGIGEDVKIKLPTSAGGKMLVSLETSAGSVEQFWVDAQAGQTEVTFKADERMVPTVYANITLLQPYEQTTNDRPVRLYGVVPIEVTDPATVLVPRIAADEEWRPKSRVRVKVDETNGKAMTYTLAVVDEGLLGLTRFQTPNLHDRFFAKEALSVRSYDLYKFVIGSLNGEFGKLLAIGGDGSNEDEEDKTANRFEPVVRHLGPFRLGGGKTGIHDIELPNYVGAVRVMVVAGKNRAYGSASERIPVVQPLMVLPTLPRVLGPGERVDMPVNVFAMSDKVKNVSISVQESEGLVTMPSASQALSFSKKGNQTAYFPLQVGDQAGIARFAVMGTGSGENASQEIEIDVRHPNEPVSRAKTVMIAPGDGQRIAYDIFGVEGTRSAIVELSALPAMQLDRHLKYLLRYPYGCVEQTVSPVFAQLYLDKLTKLSKEQESRRRTNVLAGLDRLRAFQTSGGGMAYWPGGREPHPWASNYALHFLVEAERAGFSVPLDLKNRLERFQAKVAVNWRQNNDPFYNSNAQRQRDQAYRLYGLSLAGKAEVGAMNRLKGKAAGLPTSAVYQLAAAYALVGQKATGDALMKNESPIVQPYRELGYTFGSEIRDMAMILEAQLAAKDETAAGKQVFRLAENISKRRWLSTQEAAFAFVAIGKMSEVGDRQLSADFTSYAGAKTAVGATNEVYQIELPVAGTNSAFSVTNKGSATLYATVITSGKPLPGEEQATSENLALKVDYVDDDGKTVDVTSLPSGTDFVARYTVTNTGALGMSYRQLALRSLLPSGWEVSNERLDQTTSSGGSSYDYRDIRDDRVYTFFDLNKGQSKQFSLRMTATYPGRYYLPSQVSEAMYADDVRAGVKGQWVEVTR